MNVTDATTYYVDVNLDKNITTPVSNNKIKISRAVDFKVTKNRFTALWSDASDYIT